MFRLVIWAFAISAAPLVIGLMGRTLATLAALVSTPAQGADAAS